MRLLPTNLPVGRATNYKLKTSRKAFTLIEILVVVAIIGVLAAIIIINLDKAQARSRDSRRVADLDALQVALRLYYLDTKSLPLNRSNYTASGRWCVPGTTYTAYNPGICLSELKDGGYIDKFPTDPKSPTQSYNYYNYAAYALVATSMEAPKRYGPFPYGYGCSTIEATATNYGGWWAGMACDSITDSGHRATCLSNPATYIPASGETLKHVGDTIHYCIGYLLQ